MVSCWWPKIMLLAKERRWMFDVGISVDIDLILNLAEDDVTVQRLVVLAEGLGR